MPLELNSNELVIYLRDETAVVGQIGDAEIYCPDRGYIQVKAFCIRESNYEEYLECCRLHNYKIYSMPANSKYFLIRILD